LFPAGFVAELNGMRMEKSNTPPKQKIREKIKQMTPRSCLFTVIGFFAIISLILFGGPYLSEQIGLSTRKKIDANSKVIKAVVTWRHANSKGKSISYSYWYKGKRYKDNTGGRDEYENVETGDTILIKIDSANPGSSYIFSY
jgi:hypothetical protein